MGSLEIGGVHNTTMVSTLRQLEKRKIFQLKLVQKEIHKKYQINLKNHLLRKIRNTNINKIQT